MDDSKSITGVLKAMDVSSDELGYTFSDYFKDKENVFARRLKKCELANAAEIWQYTFFLTVVLVCEAQRRSEHDLKGWDAFYEVFPEFECFRLFYTSYIGEFPMISLNDACSKIVKTLRAHKINSEHADLIARIS